MPAPAPPRLVVRRSGPDTVVRLTDCPSITEFNAEVVGAEIERAVADGSSPHLILDLSDVEFIASVGLGKLIGLNGRLRSRGGKLTLRNPRPMIREVLMVTCLDRVIDIEPETKPA